MCVCVCVYVCMLLLLLDFISSKFEDYTTYDLNGI